VSRMRVRGAARTMLRMLRSRFLLLSATACCAVALPAAAQAHSVSSDGTTVTITGTDAPESITISVDEPGFVRVDATAPTPGCDYNEPLGYASCPLGPGGVVANMGGGKDSVFDLYQAGSGGLPDKTLKVDLGAGDDTFTGGDGGETVAGGPGNDELKGAGGDDVLDGGDGNDTLTGEGGRDQLLGGGGDDVLDGDLYAGVNADLIDGGPGMDRAEGWADPSVEAEHPPISITLNGVADDGRPSEGDDVRSIERITSNVSGTLVLSDEPDVVQMWANIDNGASTIRTNGGNDVVTGGSRDETIDGGAGDDKLEGGFGNDTITGGPGRDVINAEQSASQCGLLQSCTVPFGNDTIDVRDGEADQVSCGVGNDKVVADALDTIDPDCEVVDRAGAGPAGPAGPGTKKPGAGAGGKGGAKLTLTIGRVSRRAALKSGIPVTVIVPAAGRLSGVAVKSGRTVAKGAATAKAGKRVTLRLKAVKGGKSRLRGKVTVKVTFRPAGGKATTSSRSLTLR
jgi:Ca2+-binding RTX toxin-like protein